MRRAVVSGLCALVAAGCGARHHHAPTTPSKLAQAAATHEYPSAPPAPQTATDATSTAVQAIRVFATAYINWTAQTVAGDMASLAARSVGQARSAMTLAAAQTADDY